MRLTAFERRNAIVDVLGHGRQMTIAQLAAIFNVTERTIRNDVTALSSHYPILTVRGRFGGVQMADWYHPSANRFSQKQEELLQRIKPTLAGEDLIVMHSILAQFAPSHGCW